MTAPAISPTYNPDVCEHEPHEDCLVCVDCNCCKESLDCEDRCSDCGGHDCEEMGH